jgi:hypothetical protein
MKRVALFIDGASRATLIPFAPLLLGHLMRNDDSGVTAALPVDMWPRVTYATSGMLATYMLGRALGTALGAHSYLAKRMFNNRRSKAFARSIGAILAFHLFAFGTGFNHTLELFLIRFMMGIMVGMLLRVASGNHQGFDEKRSLELSVENGVAKAWLFGFAVSMLTSGVLYYPLAHSSVYILLTGGEKPWSYLIATLFFLSVVYITELVFHICCSRLSFYDERASYELANVEDIDESYDRHSPVRRRSSKNRNSYNNENNLVCRSRVNSSTSGRGRLGSRTRRNILDSSDHMNRSRLGSAMSNDEFYDCESQCTEQEMNWLFEVSSVGNQNRPMDIESGLDHSDSIAKYDNFKCVFDDGSPSPVLASLCPSTIPEAYHAVFGQNADQKWEETKQWRIERRLWKIHSRPHRLFSIIKEAYSHNIHGFSKAGYPVVYEQPGTMTLKKIFAEGKTVEDMIYHYTYFMEYLSNNICSRPEVRAILDNRSAQERATHWGFVVVMDVSGLSLSVLSGDVMRYLQQAGAINNAHYPLSTTMALLINSPFWLSASFSTIKSILPENTKADILSGKSQLENMRKYIDDDQIPPEYGGSSPYALGEHPFEKDLEKLVESRLHMTEEDEEDDELLITSHTNATATMDTANEVQYSGEYFQTDPLQDNQYAQADFNIPSSMSDSYDYDQSDIQKVVLRREWTNKRYYAEEYILMMISIIHLVWCAAQGSLETILPIWLLAPKTIGGLAFEPRMSGFALFTASIVVMWLLRSKVARRIASIPHVTPMCGYRIGVGSEVFLLMLVPTISYISNYDSMLTLTTNILLSAAMFIASVLGRVSSSKLHTIASSAYVNKLHLRCDDRTKLGLALNKIANFVQNGGWTLMIGISGEIVGALVVSPIMVWSIRGDHSFPLNASFAFYTAAILSAFLYFFSFSFTVTIEGSSKDKSKLRKGPVSRFSIFSFVKEIVSVSAADMASLFQESNWSSSAALGRNGMKYGSKGT